MHSPIPVICDRCRAEGLAGEDPFAAFGALLDFEPVPRRARRADGWDAEVQRAYIAALSLTGADRSACRAVGRSAFGVTQLLGHEGGEGFRAAREEALAMAADERSRRLAEGLRAVASEQSGWRPPDPPWSRAASRAQLPGPPQPTEAEEEKEKLEWLAEILRQYLIKLEQERRCRLEGRIAEADFYVRQITMLEVSLDVMSGNGMQVLKDARRGEFDLLAIAETEMSKLLDAARREHWQACGDPPRPEYPPRHLLREQDGFSVEPLEATWGGQRLSHEEQRRVFEDQHARNAAAQIVWEAEARRDYERRRISSPSSLGEGDHPEGGGGAGGTPDEAGPDGTNQPQGDRP